MSCPTCGHRKADGILCGSPALRGKKLCYFHLREHKRSQHVADARRRADVLGPKLPPMKSFADILSALHEVMNAIASYRVSPQRAGIILFSLQQAALPRRKPRLAQKLTMQPLMDQYFTYNPFDCTNLPRFPAILTKTASLPARGRGYAQVRVSSVCSPAASPPRPSCRQSEGAEAGAVFRRTGR